MNSRTMQKQQTVNKKYAFEGKGLHTGKVARMTVGPAPADYGIRFLRTDIDGAIPVEALSCNVSNTARSMSISDGISTVMTIEHLLSALTGIGVDNALVKLDNIEVPILDGSAKPYLDSIPKDSLIRQDAPRRWVTIEKEVVIEDPASGSIVKVEPAEEV